MTDINAWTRRQRAHGRRTVYTGMAVIPARQVVGRDDLARHVWGDPQASLTNVIDVYINYLRKKLERLGVQGLIGTVRGVGYLFQD